MTRVFAIVAMLLLPTVVCAEDKTRGKQATFAITQKLDLAYGDAALQRLDVFSPKGDKGDKFPVVLLIHGGTWMFGDKDFFGIYRNAGKNLAKSGIVTVVANYRLSPLVRHPEHARDVARAFAWVVKAIDKYGGDPDRVVLLGHSAGGHLVSLVCSDESYLSDRRLKLTDKQRNSVKGVVSLCGLYRVPHQDDFHQMLRPIIRNTIGDSKDSRMAKALEPMAYFVGHGLNPFPWIFGRDPKVAKQASPVTHVRKGLPPFLLMTAYAEIPRLRAMAEEYEHALKRCKVDVSYHDLDHYSHNTIINQLHTQDNEVCRLVLAFVEKHAGKKEQAK